MKRPGHSPGRGYHKIWAWSSCNQWPELCWRCPRVFSNFPGILSWNNRLNRFSVQLPLWQRDSNLATIGTNDWQHQRKLDRCSCPLPDDSSDEPLDREIGLLLFRVNIAPVGLTASAESKLLTVAFLPSLSSMIHDDANYDDYYSTGMWWLRCSLHLLRLWTFGTSYLRWMHLWSVLKLQEKENALLDLYLAGCWI